MEDTKLINNYLYEYEEIENERLEEYIKDNKSLHQYFSADFGNKIKPKQYCGIISFSNENYGHL